jgi:Amt family ammonium transporter
MVKKIVLVDDALDVLGVHGVGGALGSLLLPFLTLLGGGVVLARPVSAQLGVQAIAVIVVAAWSIIATYVIAKIAAITVGLRVDQEAETLGLDFAAHGETGYHVNR